jgi:hypothetical protein
MGTAWLGQVSDCTANYRPIPLSERVPHFNNQATVTLKKRKGKSGHGSQRRARHRWSYWANLFLGEINTGTWPSRLGDSQIWDSEIWSLVPRNLALREHSRNSKLETHPLIREGVQHQTILQLSQIIKNEEKFVTGTHLCPRQTIQMTISHNITLTSKAEHESSQCLGI